MRISTAGMHNNAIATMMQRSLELARTQEQISTMKRVNSPADDPIAAVHILELERALQEAEQFARNANTAQNRLSYEEQSLADAVNVLQKVRDLTVQANSGTLDAASRELIAVEVEARLRELMDIANRKDASGEYLFSGYSTRTEPFGRNGESVTYFGDQGVRYLQITATQRIADGHSGYEVFVNVPQGNGVFVTGASAANTGTGSIDSGSVVNRATWQANEGTYTIRFTSPTEWEVVDSNNAQVTTGTFTPGGTISFNGIQVEIKGEPAAGDEFTVSPSGTEDMFTTLDKLLANLRRPSASPTENAHYGTVMAATLTQLDQALDHLSAVRGQIGARLSAIETSEASREDRKIELQESLSELRDLDYAEALTRLNQQLVGLQAAQASYMKIANLSLFNYL